MNYTLGSGLQAVQNRQERDNDNANARYMNRTNRMQIQPINVNFPVNLLYIHHI